MSLIFTIISTLTIGLIFLSTNHPLAIGLILWLQTVSIALLTGLSLPSFWFSYILFLVFLGGMLVLFIYVTSLASNEMFSISTRGIIYSSSGLSISLLIIIIYDTLLNTTLTPYNTNLAGILIKLYRIPTCWITLVLINYLLLTLIVVVKITQVNEGPLRPNH